MNNKSQHTFSAKQDNHTLFKVNSIADDLYICLKMRQHKNKIGNTKLLKFWTEYMPMPNELPDECISFINQLAEITKIEKHEFVVSAIVNYCKTMDKLPDALPELNTL